MVSHSHPREHMKDKTSGYTRVPRCQKHAVSEKTTRGFSDPFPIRLFIADTYEVIRAGIRVLLAKERNLEVVGEAGHVGQVLIGARRTKPDVILLESGLWGKEEEGDLCGKLFALIPSIRIIMTMWNHGDDDTAFSRAAEAGAQGCLIKDIGRAELIRAIRTVARGCSYFCPRSIDASRCGLHILSPQERRIIPLIAEGHTNKEIAAKLILSEKTVKNYIANMFAKLEIERRTQAAAMYFQARSGQRAKSFDCNLM